MLIQFRVCKDDMFLSCVMAVRFISALSLLCGCPKFTLLFLVNSVSPLELLGVVEALEVVFAKEGAVLGLSAARHALAEVDPEALVKLCKNKC